MPLAKSPFGGNLSIMTILSAPTDISKLSTWLGQIATMTTGSPAGQNFQNAADTLGGLLSTSQLQVARIATQQAIIDAFTPTLPPGP
jgi:hypothetical protein